MNWDKKNPEMKMGLLWSDSWCSKHEGPYTRLAKLAIVNGLRSNRINSELFSLNGVSWKSGEIHSRSLLCTHWMSKHGDRIQSQFGIALLRSSSLFAYCGFHCADIASDMHFRYCATCLAQGFQSSVHQIDGIPRCPIHGDELQDRCPSCGGHSPRYAIDASAFDQPMRCTSCGVCYASAWSLNGMVTSWTRVKERGRLKRVEDWLKKSSHLSIPGRGDYAMSGMSEQEKRLTLFDYLRRAVPLNLPGLRPIGVVVTVGTLKFNPYHWRPNPELETERTIIYKAIRRHFSRVLEIDAMYRIFEKNDDLENCFNGPMFSRYGKTPSMLHGFILWRSRFERSFSLRRGYRWKESFILEPKQITWPGKNWIVDTTTWATYVIYCLRRDLYYAHEWANCVRGLGTLPVELARHKRQELLSQFRGDLNPWSGNSPRGMGFLEPNTDFELFCLR